MKLINNLAGKAFAISALTLAMNGVLYADAPVVLTQGETITVTGTGDAIDTTGCPTACATLRSAVIYANSNGNGATHFDIINVPAGTVSLTLAGSGEDAAANGDLDLTEAVNIVGAGVGATTIDGGGSTGTLQERIFTVHGVQASIKDLTMTNGYARYDIGGTIFNDEKSILNLENCAITNSTATWDGDYTTDTMDADKNPIPDGTPGTAENPEGTTETQGHGGAIYSKDVMTIENCVFRGNTADNRVVTTVPDPAHDGEFITVKVGNGGAINASQHTVINNSTFGSDAAVDADSNAAINGGGIFLTGGNPIEISNSTFSFNDAISGGGICNVSPSAPTSIINSTISGNHVTDSGAGIETNSSMTLTNVTIANNNKDSNNKGAGLNTGPGVIINATNVLFDNNLHDGLPGTYSESSNCGAKGSGSAVESPINISSRGGNVSSDDTCNLNIALGDQENAAINLAALADNNTGDLTGTTLTHAFVDANSAGVDAGTNTNCPNNDQRGSIRPFDAILPVATAICDSGAYELYIERADLHIENMVAPDQVVLGDAATIDVVVDNGASGTAAAVELTVTLPSQLTFDSVSSQHPGSVCGGAAGIVTCTFGDLDPGAEVSASIDVTAASKGDDVPVTASVVTTTQDPVPANNTHTVFIDVAEETDLAIMAASADPASLKVGGTSTVTLSLSNFGPSAATGIEVSGVLPSIVSFVQGVGCTETNGTVTCAVDDIAVDGTASVIFEVKAEEVGTAEVTAYAALDQIDSDPSDNSATATITITSSSGGGGFCSYQPNGRFDPVLPGLLLAAMAYLGLRRKQKAAR